MYIMRDVTLEYICALYISHQRMYNYTAEKGLHAYMPNRENINRECKVK